jgi:hypothetical protein
MSDRERWIVYPLLLLALAASLKPRFVPGEGHFTRLDCEQLVAKRADCEQFVANRADVEQGIRARGLRIDDVAGKTQAALVPTPTGGHLSLVRYGLGPPDAGNQEFEIFVSTARRQLVPLGKVRIEPIESTNKDAEKGPAATNDTQSDAPAKTPPG